MNLQAPSAPVSPIKMSPTKKLANPRIDQMSPKKSLFNKKKFQSQLQLPPPLNWYNTKNIDIDDSEGEEIVAATSFDLELAGASTPLNPQGVANANSTLLFLSPMNKLNNLHIQEQPSSDKSSHSGSDAESSDYEFGNETIHHESASDEEYITALHEPPTYINQRKRKRLASDSPQSMIITPKPKDMPEASTNIRITGIPASSAKTDSKEMSDICYSTTSITSSKLSFSNSDSTPCPQPRKKLKFKRANSSLSNDITPSQASKVKRRENLLDFSGSVKTTEHSLISKLNNVSDDENIAEDLFASSPSINNIKGSVFSSGQNVQSTPISQSTPSNSRAPTPIEENEEYGESINGFKFVKPKISPNYKFETPPAKLQQLKQDFNTNNFSETPDKYQILGEIPLSAAGVMDESDDDLHVGDKRINDPYLGTPAIVVTDDDQSRLKEQYMNATQLPLLEAFKKTLDKTESLALINDGESVLDFYKYINEENVDFIRRDRLRWHPDKWVNRQVAGIDNDIVSLLAQVLNGIIETKRQL